MSDEEWDGKHITYRIVAAWHPSPTDPGFPWTQRVNYWVFGDFMKMTNTPWLLFEVIQRCAEEHGAKVENLVWMCKPLR